MWKVLRLNETIINVRAVQSWKVSWNRTIYFIVYTIANLSVAVTFPSLISFFSNYSSCIIFGVSTISFSNLFSYHEVVIIVIFNNNNTGCKKLLIGLSNVTTCGAFLIITLSFFGSFIHSSDYKYFFLGCKFSKLSINGYLLSISKTLFNSVADLMLVVVEIQLAKGSFFLSVVWIWLICFSAITIYSSSWGMWFTNGDHGLDDDEEEVSAKKRVVKKFVFLKRINFAMWQ